MSSLICDCPRSEALETIPAVNCTERFGQIQKIAFQRIYNDNGALNGFQGPTNAITTKTAWTAIMAAEDSTKVVISPYVNSPAMEAGAARTTGGGNDSLGGIEEIVGWEPSTFTAVFNNIPQSVAAIIKNIACEEVGVYYFNEKGWIACLSDGAETPKHMPIPIAPSSFGVSDKIFGGLEAHDTNNLQWMFKPGYSDKIVFVKPTDFNPLTDLVPAA